MSMLRTAFSILSGSGSRARLVVLIFHRVLSRVDDILPDEPDTRRFDQILGWLDEWFRVLPLDEAISMMREERLPSRAAAITFDDGYADNHDVALPILQRHRLSATFFIATGFLDGGRMWNDTIIESVRRTVLTTLDLKPYRLGRYPIASPLDRRAAIAGILRDVKYMPIQERIAISEALAAKLVPEGFGGLMMSPDQVLKMRRSGMGIGAHTVSHPILANLDADTARREILTSKQHLESILGEKVTLFAYPNGRPGKDFLPRDVELVRELGFEAAVSTRPAIARAAVDRLLIPRFTPWDQSKMRFGARLAMKFPAH